MNLSEEVDLEDYVSRPDKINNAEISSICQVRCGAARRGWGGQRGGAVERCGGAGPCRSRGEV